MALVMPSRTRRPSRRSSFRRRQLKTQWVTSSVAFSLTPGTPTIALPVIPNALLKTITEPLFWGGHLEVLVSADTVDDVPSTGFIALGLHVLPERVSQGTVWPLPWSDSEGDWPWHRMVTVSSGPRGAAATPHFSDVLEVARWHDVCRSRRRMSTDDVMVLIGEMPGGGAFPSVGQVCVIVHTRLLVREK